MQLHGTPAARHRRDGPARPVEVVAATAHRETGELLHGPPAPPSPSAPHQHPLRVSGDPAPPLPAGPGRADGIQRDVPRRPGPVIRRPRVANPSYVSRKSGAEQATCLPDQDHGQVIAPLGQLLVQAAEHLLAAIGQTAAGVRIGDHHDPPAARRTVSPTRTPVSRRVAPATLVAATSSTCPNDSSPSSA